MRYQTYDFYTRAAENMNGFFALGHQIMSHPSNPWSYTLLGKSMAAGFESANRTTKRYDKIGFHYDSTTVSGESVRVIEEVVRDKPFCQLRRFKREATNGHTQKQIEAQPKLLVVAALSGHHATLLKDTVKAMLPDHDVYITDWADARNVPLEEGSFGFDEYVSYLIEFMETLGPNSHTLAVCQPTVQALIATAVMSEQNNPCAPKTLTLMAGPIDTRINPNQVNEYAASHSIDFFRKFAIMTVPFGYAGAGRRVYPGFLQLGSFMAMNLDSHLKKHLDYFTSIMFGKHEVAETHREFYDEYMAVLDMSEEFYLETLEKVFIEHHLPTGKITYGGEPVDFSAIKNTALHTVEGEQDDICSVGQTEAAQVLCTSLPDNMRLHDVHPGVGHYGIFSGSRFRNEIAPKLRNFIASHD